MTASPDLLTASEAAEHLRISLRHLRQLCSDRAIPVVRLGRRTLFSRAALDRWVAAKADASTPAPRPPINPIAHGHRAGGHRTPPLPTTPGLPINLDDRPRCPTTGRLRAIDVD